MNSRALVFAQRFLDRIEEVFFNENEHHKFIEFLQILRNFNEQQYQTGAHLYLVRTLLWPRGQWPYFKFESKLILSIPNLHIPDAWKVFHARLSGAGWHISVLFDAKRCRCDQQIHGIFPEGELHEVSEQIEYILSKAAGSGEFLTVKSNVFTRNRIKKN